MPQENLDNNDINFYNMITSNGTTQTSVMKYEDIEAAIKRCLIHVMDTVDEFSCRNPYCTVYLLDCCRVDLPRSADRKDWRNPGVNFESRTSTLHVNAGYLIGCACLPGTRASDNESQENGLYTKYLLQYLSQPNLDVRKVMAAVTYAVKIESNHRQSPESILGILTTDDIYLCENVSCMLVT